MIEKTIYTIGTSNRTLREFTALLEKFEIEMLVDVRRFPTSKFEHFRKNNLEGSFKKRKMDYIYLGLELGGYRKGGYPEYMKTQAFKDGMTKLKNLAGCKKAAVFCAERLPWRCHRRFIGNYLQENSFRVIHIIEENKVWESKNEGSSPLHSS